MVVMMGVTSLLVIPSEGGTRMNDSTDGTPTRIQTIV